MVLDYLVNDINKDFDLKEVTCMKEALENEYGKVNTEELYSDYLQEKVLVFSEKNINRKECLKWFEERQIKLYGFDSFELAMKAMGIKKSYPVLDNTITFIKLINKYNQLSDNFDLINIFYKAGYNYMSFSNYNTVMFSHENYDLSLEEFKELYKSPEGKEVKLKNNRKGIVYSYIGE